MIDPVLLVVHVLAAARLTGALTTDTVTEPLRDRVLVALDDRPSTAGASLAMLIQCQWCVSVWVCAVAAPLVWLWGDHPVVVVAGMAMAGSQVVGMLSGVGR